jgi:hypothetical protein
MSNRLLYTSTYNRLNHIRALATKLSDQIEDINFIFMFKPFETVVNNNECTRSTNTSTAVDNHWT